MKWKIEYDYTFYKVYDGKSNLAGYFFPHYGEIFPAEKEDEVIEKMNKSHDSVPEATLLVPMVKLDVFDKENMETDYVVSSLEANLQRIKYWKGWLQKNSRQYSIFGSSVHTAREDRNMLSIALGIAAKITLGEKEIKEFLNPLLDRLHEDGLL